ncbi:hypothetical protein RFI_31564 [Reticulomyxa filosa]|uniref:Uncharacterized protein n=1 Tax=Reticulomyxa filosa TaxID=46433 RepID=X6LWU4_RETFI|nr:hypothetical protein RFI_31564 [Reticulomyxa filosa]|eukprot:ETO05831.1 hypothetical protein RFI_31564 [Reticulomyxa filosa]
MNGFHRNYQSCRKSLAVKKYCSKEKNYITNIINFSIINPAVKAAIEGDLDDSMNIIINDPVIARDYLRDNLRMEQSVERLSKSNIERNNKYKFKNVNDISNWNRSKHELWLHGQTKLVKPNLRYHFLKTFVNILYDGIVFDDMNLVNWTIEERVHILDLDETTAINVKYGMLKYLKAFQEYLQVIMYFLTMNNQY